MHSRFWIIVVASLLMDINFVSYAVKQQPAENVETQHNIKAIVWSWNEYEGSIKDGRKHALWFDTIVFWVVLVQSNAPGNW